MTTSDPRAQQRPQQQRQVPAPPQPRPEPQRTVRARRIAEIFDGKGGELASLFPKDGATFAARARSAAIQLSRTFKDNVTAESIAEAVIACHGLGLEVGSHAYVYPYGSEAKLTVGPQGLVTLAFRGGFLKSIVARCVFEGDEFDYNLGTNEIVHRKMLGTETTFRRPFFTDEHGESRPVSPERLISHAYAVIDTTTDGRFVEVLTWEDIAYFRSFSKADKGPWFDNFEGMARKTALKRALYFVPQSPMLVAAMREREDGSYQVPEELLVAARSKAGLDVPADLGGEQDPAQGSANGGASVAT